LLRDAGLGHSLFANAAKTYESRNALLLTLASRWDDCAELAPLFHVKQKDVLTTSKAQDRLRAQNDMTVARLYGNHHGRICAPAAQLRGHGSQAPAVPGMAAVAGERGASGLGLTMTQVK